MRRLRLITDLPLRLCDEDFAAMPLADGGRHCDACEKIVHDLSALTRRAAERLVADRTGPRRCYRYLARRDGTIVFAAEPPRPAAPALALVLAACTPWGPPPAPAMDDTPAEFAAPAPVVIPVIPVVPDDPALAIDPDAPPDDIAAATNPTEPTPAPPQTTPAKSTKPQAPATKAVDPDIHEYAGIPFD